MYKERRLTVIIAAGGAGTRFGSEGPKQFLDVGGKSMIAMATEPFLQGSYTDEIIFVVPGDYMGECSKLLERDLGAGPVRTENPEGRLSVISEGREISLNVVCGGGDRAASVRAGFAALDGPAPGGLVLIHDAARPFVSRELIGRVLDAAYEYGAAVPVIPIHDTVYEEGRDGFAARVRDRMQLRSVQTPQGFDFELIKGAHERALAEELVITDDGTPVLTSGGRVFLVEGDPGNIKITTPDDLLVKAVMPGSGGMRTGIGFDAHRFEKNRALILGGIEIPFERGLAGHSDADVLTHALMDAILGALREGDIGKLFPDNDPDYAGASSIKLLSEVVSIMKKREYSIVNADMTLVAERPRMAPYRESIERRLATVLETEPENISLKATTTEKLGFTGREEGIAAEAIVLLEHRQAIITSNYLNKQKD